MTVGRLVAWVMLWMSGWALFFIHPVGHSSSGSVLLLVAASLLIAAPRDRGAVRLRREVLALMMMVCLFLALDYVLPPSFTWQFPADPRLLMGLEAFGALVAVFGIVVTAHRFIRDCVGAA